MKKFLAAVGMCLAVALSTSACGTEVEPITGTIDGKYIEDFEENTIILKADDGTLYHFAVEADQWNALKVGDRFSTAQLDQPADD
jgi:hypothetical protein